MNTAGSPMVRLYECDLQASINKEGNITYWSHETFSDTFLTRPVIGKEPGSRLLSSHFVENLKPWPVTPPMLTAHGGIHRNMEPLYNLPSQRLVKHRVYDLPLRTSALRALGAFGNIFAIESMMDELAVLSGLNPFEFRSMHLSDTRAMETLKKLKKIIESLQNEFSEWKWIRISFSRYKNSAGYCLWLCFST